jgi:antitoxin component of RelBE/YafQ-DinJ toxin-antitoxin module
MNKLFKINQENALPVELPIVNKNILPALKKEVAG